ncbi:MAG: UDP-2-acetamido-2,6-beta-L-arabino-hexul-4-ose reductase [Providencia rustigianii]|uniref:UDP-2-acetamido-2,6-beta-L-arabino-hexul-4-ose reductase n=1 Tax=Providencia rustigianii TaxID=158850 RepID=UPI003F31EEEA
MKILVTGANGFIGKNLCIMLRENGYQDIIEINRETPLSEFKHHLCNSDFIYHLAGVNRPEHEDEFFDGNANLTNFIIEQLQQSGKNPPLVITSSTQADKDNAYGKSKRLAELAVQQYGAKTQSPYFIYRLPNVFGKWCKPNYNSFVATFCHNILNSLDVTVHNPNAPVTLVYIDDVCRSLISLLSSENEPGFKQIQPEYLTTVGDVAEKIQEFKESRNSLIIDSVGIGLTRALYSTYLSYMRPTQFSYTVPIYSDQRGSFSEMLKTKQSGQFSFFTALPGVTRGGHYHHTKNEKFLVLKGKALFKFKNISTGEYYEMTIDSSSPTIVETIPGWSHDITNISNEEMVVILWANEIFDRNIPDTYSYPL